MTTGRLGVREHRQNRPRRLREAAGGTLADEFEQVEQPEQRPTEATAPADRVVTVQ